MGQNVENYEFYKVESHWHKIWTSIGKLSVFDPKCEQVLSKISSNLTSTMFYLVQDTMGFCKERANGHSLKMLFDSLKKKTD
jgi:hypothetical protein